MIVLLLDLFHPLDYLFGNLFEFFQVGHLDNREELMFVKVGDLGLFEMNLEHFQAAPLLIELHDLPEYILGD